MPISKYPRWPALGPILFPGQAAPGTFRNSGRSALHTFKYPGLSFFVTNVTLDLPPSSFVTKNHQPFLVKNKSLKKKEVQINNRNIINITVIINVSFCSCRIRLGLPVHNGGKFLESLQETLGNPSDLSLVTAINLFIA